MDDRIKETEILLEGRGLTRRFAGKNGHIDALIDVSFCLRRGEFLGIVGESGSGKSTLLRAVAGLLPLDEGSLFFEGIPVTGQGPRRMGERLQMIFQDPEGSFDPRMTMEHSIRECGGKGTDRESIRRLLSLTGLEEGLLERKPAALSGGQCQRMAIVRALVGGVRLLLCDEITSALDVSSQAQIMEILKKLRKENGLSALVVSHDLALVRMLCDRVLVMHRGRVAEEGSVGEILHDPRDPYTVTLLESARRQSM